MSEAFTVAGYINWKKAMEKTLVSHNTLIQKLKSFVSARPVHALLSDENARLMSQRQAVVAKLFGVVTFIARLGHFI